MPIGGGSPSWATGSDGASCARSPRSSRRTRFCDGPAARRAQMDIRKEAVQPPWGLLAEIRRFVVRMAEENPTCGYTRIQGALKNVGHRVGRSTIARILKRNGLPPVPERPTSWQTFLRAHWGAIAGADFFTTEVWTWRGLARTRPCSPSTSRHGASRLSGRHGIQMICSCAKSAAR